MRAQCSAIRYPRAACSLLSCLSLCLASLAAAARLDYDACCLQETRKEGKVSEARGNKKSNESSSLPHEDTREDIRVTRETQEEGERRLNGRVPILSCVSPETPGTQQVQPSLVTRCTCTETAILHMVLPLSLFLW